MYENGHEVLTVNPKSIAGVHLVLNVINDGTEQKEYKFLSNNKK